MEKGLEREEKMKKNVIKYGLLFKLILPLILCLMACGFER